MTKPFVLVTLAFMTLIACNGAAKTEHEHESYGTQVTLNEGQKWEANVETTQGIMQMRALLTNMPDNLQLSDCSSLKEMLMAEYNTLIAKCTMTGEAHNQLHNYLIPIQDMFPDLDSGSLKNCQDVIDALREHLSDYDKYFK
jgi:hypothetical protein